MPPLVVCAPGGINASWKGDPHAGRTVMICGKACESSERTEAEED